MTFTASVSAPEDKRGGLREGLIRRRLKKKRERGGGLTREEQMKAEVQAFRRSSSRYIRSETLQMDLSFLQVLERERVLEVLHRDKHLRKIEEERIRWVMRADM